MKKILLILLISTGFISCQMNPNSAGIVLKNDEKSNLVKSHMEAYMENDSSVAENLFSEDLLLYDQFANNQEENTTVHNPGGRQGLIDGDKFTHMLFSEIQLTTDKISTYQMDDGKTYTAFWSMWSGTGKFTGQEMTLPFYCISLWKGNQITKIWRYMDPAGLTKEVTAYEGETNTSKKVVANIDMAVNAGYSKEDVKTFLAKLNKFIRTNEPNTYDYSYFISEDGKRITLIEKFKTSEDFIFHVEKFENGPNIEPFMKMFTFNSFVIAGNTTEALRDRIKSYPVEYRGNIGGWVY